MAAGYKAQALEVADFYSYGCYLRLNEPALERILLDSRVRDSKVMVVSVSGRFRKGNSFLLSVMLRYLRKFGKANCTKGDFKWGVYGGTTGFNFWSEPFFLETESGEEVCVLLMDTQGLNQLYCGRPISQITLMMNSLIASVQICSLRCWKEVLIESQHLIDYGKLALNVYKAKPYQTLCIVDRDWTTQKNIPSGFEGGKIYMKEAFEMNDTECKILNEGISQCYEDIYAFVLPYPGAHVRSSKFKGDLYDEDVNPEFHSHLVNLIEHLLHPKNIVVKEICGKQVTGKELFHYFKSYFKVCNSLELPDKMDFIKATDEAIIMNAMGKAGDFYRREPRISEESAEGILTAAVKVYRREMDMKMYDASIVVDRNILDECHKRSYEMAVETLKRTDKQNLGKELKGRLLQLYDDYKNYHLGFEAGLKSLSLTSENMNDKLTAAETKKGK